MGKFLKKYLRQAPLSYLSVTNDPNRIPDNHERLEAFRDCVRPSLHNSYPWPHLKPKVPARVVHLRAVGGRR